MKNKESKQNITWTVKKRTALAFLRRRVASFPRVPHKQLESALRFCCLALTQVFLLNEVDKNKDRSKVKVRVN
jgi:hypothetical protein